MTHWMLAGHVAPRLRKRQECGSRCGWQMSVLASVIRNCRQPVNSGQRVGARETWGYICSRQHMARNCVGSQREIQALGEGGWRPCPGRHLVLKTQKRMRRKGKKGTEKVTCEVAVIFRLPQVSEMSLGCFKLGS